MTLEQSKSNHPAGKKRGPAKGTPNVAAREAAERRRRLQAEIEARYEAQEAKRAPRIQIDQRSFLWVWLVGVGVSFLASAVISFNGITAEAYNIGLQFEWMQYLMFFVVEFMYLVFLAAYLVLKSRGESPTGALIGMWFFAGVAVYANAMHSFQFNNWDYESIATWTGVVLGVSAPIAIIAMSKLASKVVFAERITV